MTESLSESSLISITGLRGMSSETVLSAVSVNERNFKSLVSSDVASYLSRYVMPLTGMGTSVISRGCLGMHSS